MEPTPTAPRTTDVACDTNALGITGGEPGPMKIQSRPVCFTAPDESATLVHLSSEDVTVSVTSWVCVNDEPNTRTATLLGAGEDVVIPQDACRFSVSSSGPVDGYELRWSLE